ncbi:proteophosphoglycan 5 [Rhodotorula toruloides]|uniref:Proteophosphoglycan 5 n=1 Tax=Rhodotorula toruloides TaxID=5286 RepID=A0A511KII7_RHOTO|nr:proteophosphoglycan 5 [Rhodotorula toruloides]
MLPFRQAALFALTSSTPSPVTTEQGLTPRHTLNVHDLDGEGRTWRVGDSVAKVSIYKSKNLTLHLAGRILTSTVELFESGDIHLIVGDSLSSSSPLGTLQLDPSLHNVSIQYATPANVGKVVLAPLLAEDSLGARSFGFSQLSLQAGAEDEPFVVVDAEGRIRQPSDADTVVSPLSPPADMPQQLVYSYDGGRWRVEGLERREKDYPNLAS